MAYPTYDQLYGSQFEPLDDTEVAVTAWGDAETSTGFGANNPGRYRIVHHLTDAQVSALLSDYDTNRHASFTLAWQEDSTNVTVYYASPPQIQRLAPDLSRAEVVLMRDIEAATRVTEGHADTRVTEGGADTRVTEA